MDFYRLTRSLLLGLLLLGMSFIGWRPITVIAKDSPTCPPLPAGANGSLSKDCPKPARYNTLPSLPVSSGGPDQFGYSWDDTATYAWVDATGGTPIWENSYYDDEMAGPIALPFSFEFYENTFSQVYVSTNGLIGFDDSIGDRGASYENLPIPTDYEFPQNLAAPFWDDLAVFLNDPIPSGVYYTNGSDAHGDYFAVEWYQVSRLGSGNLLTFEVLLYANGDILFQYQDVNGALDESTIGIEDGDGMDGLQVLYNGSGTLPADGKAILFTRPPASYRVKAFPHQQNNFTIDFWSQYEFYVRNTGEQGVDTYNLSPVIDTPSWEAYLYDASTSQLLSDTTSDGLVDTGVLAQGETFTVTVKLKAPASAYVSHGAGLDLTISSYQDPTRTQVVEFDTVIPAPFALVFRQGQRVQTQLNAPHAQFTSMTQQFYTGSTFVINNAANANFIVLWERNQGSLFTNLEYNLVTSTGLLLYDDPLLLTENTDTNYDIRDFVPVVATAPNGNIGIAWRRLITRLSDAATNRNIYFAILSPDGSSRVLDVYNVTNDSNWYSFSDPDIPSYEDVQIIADGDDHFHLAWVEKHNISGNIHTDLATAIYDAADGSQVKAPGLITSGLYDDNLEYNEPALMEYRPTSNAKQVMLLYFVHDSGSSTDQLMYLLFNIGGTQIQGETLLHDGFGYGPDAIQLSDGRVALAWTDAVQAADRVAYQIWDQNLTTALQAGFLTNPDNRPAGRVSVTRDNSGHAILTWMDVKWYQRLYYALVDFTGVITPPLIFRTVTAAQATALETNMGLGNAIYDPPWWRLVFPMVYKDY